MERDPGRTITAESSTYSNIAEALERELMASARYSISAEKAREDGYEQIADIFEETSKNEMEHAKILLKLINNNAMPSTPDNLKSAYTGEYREWTSIYVSFAEKAREEGYNEIARLFECLAGIEMHHDVRFRKLAQNIMNNQVFCKKDNALWICMKCGYLVYGGGAPDICPVCMGQQGYYQLNRDNY